MGFAFVKATKEASKGRIALIGPAGSGKTYSALAIASALGKRVACIDTEHGSARKYADVFNFDVLELDSFSPTTYCQAIRAAEEAGYDVLVIDSLSHAWMGKDGALEQVDAAAKKNRGNSFAGWRDVTPQHNALVEVMISARLHLIVCMRSKTEWIVEEDGRGKKVPKKIGLAPVQKDGLEYEFDVVGDIDLDHNWIISKTRCPIFDGKIIPKPGLDFARAYGAWLDSGTPPAEPASQPAPAPTHLQVVPSAAEPYRIPKGVHAGKTLPECPLEYLIKLHAAENIPDKLRDLLTWELDSRREAAARAELANKPPSRADAPSPLAVVMQASIDLIEAQKRAVMGDIDEQPAMALEAVDEETGEVERRDPLGLNGDPT